MTASRLLGLTLTQRQGQPMAGLPYHAAENYVRRLLAAGQKVAICDQQEAARPGKLVRRQLTRILTPERSSRPTSSRPSATITWPPSRWTPGAACRLAGSLHRRIQGRERSADRQPAPILTALDPAELLVAEGEPARWQAAPHEDGRPARPAGLRRRARLHRARGLPFRDDDRREDGDGRPRRPQPARFRPRPRSRRPGTGRRARALRRRQPLRQAGEPAGPAGVPERAGAAAGPGDPAQPGDLHIEPRDARGIAAGGDQPHGDRAGRPPVGALAGRPHPGSGGDRPPPDAGGRADGAADAPGRAAGGPRPGSATFPASSAGCRTACAIPGSWVGSATRWTGCPGCARSGRLRRRDRGRTRARRDPGICRPARPARPGAGRRAARRPERRRLHPPRPRSRAGPAAGPDERQQDLAVRARAGGAGAHRDPQPEGQVHQQFRLLHRDHEGEPAPRPGRLRAPPDDGGGRALCHRRPAAEGKGDLPRRGKRPGARAGALPRAGRVRPRRGRGAGAGRRRAGGAGRRRGLGVLARDWDYCRPVVDESDVLEIEDGRHPVVEQVLRAAGRARPARPRPSCRTTPRSRATMRRSR